MEPDQPPAEASDDLKPQQSTTHAPRSYECHYCKRGFTNAQALGGHMNIHRKDKNKSKHTSTSTTTMPPNHLAEPPTATVTSTANPFSISHQGNLFLATQQADDINKPIALFDREDSAVSGNINQSGNPPLQDEDVDLELRLGHTEPQPESSLEKKNIITTRKFF